MVYTKCARRWNFGWSPSFRCSKRTTGILTVNEFQWSTNLNGNWTEPKHNKAKDDWIWVEHWISLFRCNRSGDWPSCFWNKVLFPNSIYRMMQGHLLSQGYSVTQVCIQDTLQRVESDVIAIHWNTGIEMRRYKVKSPITLASWLQP